MCEYLYYNRVGYVKNVLFIFIFHLNDTKSRPELRSEQENRPESGAIKIMNNRVLIYTCGVCAHSPHIETNARSSAISRRIRAARS